MKKFKKIVLIKIRRILVPLLSRKKIEMDFNTDWPSADHDYVPKKPVYTVHR
jgi:hypothetical protein